MKRALAVFAAALLLCGPAPAQQVSEAAGSQLRGIDKINGEIFDIRVPAGQTVQLESLRITVTSCRYPIGNPAGDAFASLRITDAENDAVLFEGWMIASSPALSAMDHPRYDVWVIRCTTS